MLIAVLAVFIWSAIRPRDYLIWLLEALPVMVGGAMLLATYRRFPFTSLAYILIAAHAIILLIGAHYTYPEVPLFNWLKDTFDMARNHYDRIGHFFQGFSPAIVAREVLIRKSPLKPGGWLFFLVVTVCLSVSAVYEILEWWVALISNEAAGSFLGAQGDIWDTQWDMFLALMGSIASQLILDPVHDAELEEMGVLKGRADE